MKPKTIALLLVIALFLTLLLLNMQRVEFQMYFWPIKMPLLIVILSSLFLGWIIGWLSHVFYRRGKQKPESIKKATEVEKTVETKEHKQKETIQPRTSNEID